MKRLGARLLIAGAVVVASAAVVGRLAARHGPSTIVLPVLQQPAQITIDYPRESSHSESA